MTQQDSINKQELIQLLKSEVALYQSLLDIEARKIPLYIKGDLEGIENARSQSKAILIGIRTVQKGIKQHLKETSLSEVISRLESSNEKQEGIKALRTLHRLLQELKRINLRNNGYTQTSLAFTQSMLQAIFPRSASYNQTGYVEAERCHSGESTGLKL